MLLAKGFVDCRRTAVMGGVVVFVGRACIIDCRNGLVEVCWDCRGGGLCACDVKDC